MTLSASLYQHTNYGGRSASMHLRYYREFGGIPTYASLSKSAFDAYDMHDKTSSLQVTASDYEQGGNVILFQDSRFRGRYAMFDCTPGQTNETSQLSSIDFDNRTSSALVVRRFKAECPPIPISSLMPTLLEKLRTIIFYYDTDRLYTHEMASIVGTPNLGPTSYEAAGTYYEMRGDPIISWDMWPTFSPARMYVHVRVPMKKGLVNWFDYDCEVRYWIYLYIDSGGKLRGHVDRYGAWVDGGLYSSPILDQLMWFIPSSIDRLGALVAEAVAAWEPLTFERLYYLPGQADGTGHVNDGVRLVLVTEA